ncbi:TetR/AcrR family transcriptional regulator [Streptococcus dentapri]|uniref:TetR/AcrR family transcriptional regulator n=1 Tax=Streptococcus dentapri TaxID=573564 RepID=A0ABV8CZQ5_9STRE
MTSDILLSYADRLQNESMPPGKKKTLLAAVTLFAQQGFNGTSTAQLAQTAGVSQAAIFKYFKTKDDILQSILEQSLPYLIQDFISELSQYSALTDIIHFTVFNRFAFIKQNQEIIKIIFQELLVNPNLKTFIKSNFDNPTFSGQLKLFIEQLAANNPQFNKKLTLAEIIRIWVANLGSYFFQRFVLDIPTEDETADLTLIEQQIMTLLSS